MVVLSCVLWRESGYFVYRGDYVGLTSPLHKRRMKQLN
jgi:hypothetical protein